MTLTDTDLRDAKNPEDWVCGQGSCCELLPRLASEIEAGQAHNQELIAGIFAGQVREQNLEVRIAELEWALRQMAQVASALENANANDRKPAK